MRSSLHAANSRSCRWKRDSKKKRPRKASVNRGKRIRRNSIRRFSNDRSNLRIVARSRLKDHEETRKQATSSLIPWIITQLSFRIVSHSPFANVENYSHAFFEKLLRNYWRLDRRLVRVSKDFTNEIFFVFLRKEYKCCIVLFFLPYPSKLWNDTLRKLKNNWTTGIHDRFTRFFPFDNNSSSVRGGRIFLGVDSRRDSQPFCGRFAELID